MIRLKYTVSEYQQIFHIYVHINKYVSLYNKAKINVLNRIFDFDWFSDS